MAERVTTYGEDGNRLYDTLLALIAGARRRVWIKVPWWDMSAPSRRLVDVVIEAAGRGVEVQVLYRPEASNDAVLRELQQAGVATTGVRYIHEKELIADDTAVTHSMNFTLREIERNQNSGHVFTESDVIDALEAGFRALLDNRAAVTVGEESWTPSAALIPPGMQKYLTRYERLNPLQSKAVPAILSTPGHVMVVAPTSAGKTLIGEVAALRSIVTEGKPAVWLLPARALAAEIGETAGRWNEHGIRAVELTGETNFSSEAVRQAQLWVATTEKFEALYRRSSLRDFIANLGCIVIDEVHLVGDPDRGATLESLIARLRSVEGRTRIVALSATVSNADKLAEWFNAQLVRSAWRPTALTTQLVPYDAPATGARRESFESAKDRALRPLFADLRAATRSPDTESPSGEGSILVFCGSKNAVRRTAALAADLQPWGMDDARLVDAAFARGVGIYFRDAPRAERALAAFKDRSIRTLVATSGLSTGVNTPARVVVIRDLELGMSPLEVSQAQQMFGRAGRAGQEPEGYGFMLVPREQEIQWRAKLVDGYAARSRVLDSLPDVILAEILLGSIPDRASAAAWFKGTLAYAQSGQPHDIDDALDRLVHAGFVTETEAGLAVTDLGALTSRLMIDVESAGELLSALAEAPLPVTADEAEETVLQITATSVAALRRWPVNRKKYGPVVEDVLASWSPRVTARARDEFGSRFCLAAAHLALRDPRKLQSKPPPGISLADFRRVIEDMPRYLAWISALGFVSVLTWAPAVAGELARRLSWWFLSPHPDRGAGRLLWMLERTLQPENRRTGMQDLWGRARRAGFATPDRLDTRPRGVDLSVEAFTELVRSRAVLHLAAADSTTVPVAAATGNSRLTVMTNTGPRQAVSTAQPVTGHLELPIPGGSGSGTIAADVFLYTRDGDFAYRNLVTALPASAVATTDPLGEAAQLIAALPETATVARPIGRLRGLFMSDRRRQEVSVRPLLAPDPQLRPIAMALAEYAVGPETAVLALDENLRKLLTIKESQYPRPAAAVLRSGYASDDEFASTLVALAGALQFSTGIATSAGKMVPLIQIAGDWYIAVQNIELQAGLEPVLPAHLPSIIKTVQPPVRDNDVVIVPRCDWLREFTPTA